MSDVTKLHEAVRCGDLDGMRVLLEANPSLANSRSEKDARRTYPLHWRRCTAIVWLDYSFARVLSQALRRTIRRVVMGERLYGSNRETIGNALFDAEAPLWLVVRTYGKRRREFPELFRRPEYRHATVIQLHAPAAAETFLAEARARAEQPAH